MRTLFEEIKARIIDEVADVKFVRMYNDQFALIEGQEIYAFDFPCIFIEFEDEIQWSQLGDGVQIAEPLTVIHIGHNMYDAGDGNMEENLDVFDFKQTVYEKLQDWQPTRCSSFVRKSENQDKMHKSLYHFTQTYTTALTDSSMQQSAQGLSTTIPAFNITGVFDPEPFLKTT